MLSKILWGLGGMVLVAAVVVGGLLLQSSLTANAIAQEWHTTKVTKIQDPGTTQTVEILPLFEEAEVRPNLEPEHGVSYLIKTDNGNFLLDVGMTPARLAHNMQLLKVTEKDFDTVVITHLHPDHMGGSDAWWNDTLTAGDPALNLDGKRVYVPMAVKNTNLNTIVSTQPVKLADGVALIGAIPFPELFPLSLRAQRNAEQGLAVNIAGKGIVLITGCGHPTIERMVARAQVLFDAPIVGLVGGLHYEGLTAEQVQPHIAFVKTLDPQLIAVSPHDSSAAAMYEFQKAFPYAYEDLAVGRTIKFPLVREAPLVLR